MFDLRIPESLARLPGRTHTCVDDMEGVERHTKKCGHCGEVKDESAYFIVKANGLLRSYCKACMVKKSTEWNRVNRARIRARKAAKTV